LDTCNFQLFWEAESDVRAACFNTRLLVGESSGDAKQGGAVSVDGFVLETSVIPLSPYNVLVAFKVRNTDSQTAACSVGLWGDLVVGNNNGHDVALMPGLGWRWSHEAGYIANIIWDNYGPTLGASTYWLGPWNGVEDNL
jgi:hypothetical protein